jgi:hypothetical protein
MYLQLVKSFRMKWDNQKRFVCHLLNSYFRVERPAQFDAWIDMYGGEDFEREVSGV